MKYPTLFLPLLCLFAVSFAQPQEYVLQPGDVLSIQVVEHPEFSGKHKIRPDGRINYPVIGEVEVSGLTPAQLVKVMQGKLASYVNNPVVSVAIEAYYANKIYIIGDVQRTGEFEIYEPVDVMKSLAMCGGLNNQNVKGIRIIRSDGSVMQVPREDIYSGKAKEKYVLYPGDTLYVPEGFNIPWGMISTILTTISTSLSIYLTISTISSR